MNASTSQMNLLTRPSSVLRHLGKPLNVRFASGSLFPVFYDAIYTVSVLTAEEI